MKIGVISDTHGCLDPKVLELFAGVSHILHAGDIGPDASSRSWKRCAGDGGDRQHGQFIHFPAHRTVALAGHKFLVHHIVDPYALKEELQLRIARERPDVVVFGHTHKGFCERWAASVFQSRLAGKPKHGGDARAAILHCEGKEIRPEFGIFPTHCMDFH